MSTKAMTKTEYLKCLSKLGLSIVGAAPAVGIGRRQAQRLAAGDAPVPEPVAKLLRIFISHKINPVDVP